MIINTVVECIPKVSEVQMMLEELNRDNNISRFMVQMRKKFQAKCIQWWSSLWVFIVLFLSLSLSYNCNSISFHSLNTVLIS